METSESGVRVKTSSGSGEGVELARMAYNRNLLLPTQKVLQTVLYLYRGRIDVSCASFRSFGGFPGLMSVRESNTHALVFLVISVFLAKHDIRLTGLRFQYLSSGSW